MIERLYEYLAERPAGADAEDLLSVVFGPSAGDPAFGRHFLDALLADDPRFVCTADGFRWLLADKHLLDEPLSEAPFVVVDLETTGQSPDEAGITEIGAVRMLGDREIDRFETLVRPGRPIPPYVASLTGISDAMVADAPSIEEVLPRFLGFASGAVVVAHNAAFDVALLDRACRRILNRRLGMPSLCTFKLARRLLPDLTKASLDGLAAHFALAKSARHRALADAELTAAVLVRLVRLLESGGPATVNALIEAQEDPGAPRQLSIRIPRDRLEVLPERAGVFWLIGSDEQTLFVGQADDVRARVVSYFAGRAHLSDRQFEMVSATRDVGFRAADTGLERSLIEAEEICRRLPLLNRPDKHLPRGNFIKVQKRGRYPRVLIAPRMSSDGALYLGPIKSRAFADDVAVLVAKAFGLRTCAASLHPAPAVEPCWLGPAGWCSSPCNATVSSADYRAQIDKAETVLAGDPLLLRSSGALQARDGEDGRSRDGAVIGRLLKLHRKRHWLINTHSYVAAVPAAEGGLWIAVVLGGFCRRLVRARTTAELTSALEPDIRTSTARISHFEADVSTVLAHWIRRPAEEAGLVVIDLEDDSGSSLPLAFDKLVTVLGS